MYTAYKKAARNGPLTKEITTVLMVRKAGFNSPSLMSSELMNKEASSVFCSVAKHLGSGRALKK